MIETIRYQSKYDHKKSGNMSSRYMYHCVQISTRQNAPKKSTKDAAIHRDKIAMDTFECGGWLHITVWDFLDVAQIKIDHHESHIPYWSIDVPQEVIDYVTENVELSLPTVSSLSSRCDFRFC